MLGKQAETSLVNALLIEKLLPNILGRLAKENPSKRRCKVAFVRPDVISFGTISLRYVQLVKQKLVYACRAAVSVVRYVYAYQLFVQVSTTVRYATKCGVKSHDTLIGLLGTFQALNVDE